MYHNNQYKYSKMVESNKDKKERKKPKKKLNQLFECIPKKRKVKKSY